MQSAVSFLSPCSLYYWWVGKENGDKVVVEDGDKVMVEDGEEWWSKMESREDSVEKGRKEENGDKMED
ncbi:hypothetical protein Pcinc_023967 [Petrolisthes cinctipes]|uniref:Uncharacterized protein n=1 Tax=Petrolisthes cinctipes TaxID=88211 RepID=A0AAE1FAT1_PETCI|nr:hypothetical protein Pcinc_023967 [Petrolisthes cinctipes]